MILSELKNSERIESLHPKFKLLFDYVKNNDLLNMETGRIELDGDALFINNVNPALMPAEDQVLEIHHQYIDVHFPLDKAEMYAWKATENCNNLKAEYTEKDDYGLYSDSPENYFTVKPGQFLVVYPEDAHGPLIGEGKIRKLIAKVKI